MLNRNESLKAPKGTTISRRLMYLLLGTFFFVAIIFVIFLNMYSSKSVMRVSAEDEKAANFDASLSMIRKIIEEHQMPIATVPQHTLSQAEKKTPENQNSMNLTVASTNESSEELKAASNASVEVYHGNDPGFTSADDSTNHSSAGSNSNLSQSQSGEKQAIVQSQQTQNLDVIGAQLQKPNSVYELKAGTIVPAILMTGIQSDLPGTIIAKVRENLYDTVSGNYLLIPQGTTIIGTYDSQVAFGQSRVLIAWSRLIFPNGTSFDLLGMPGADLEGRSGLYDQVDNHYLRMFGSSMMLSIFGAAGQLSQPRSNGQDLTTQQILYGAVGVQMSETAAQLMEKNLNIQPTLNIRQGAKFNVLLTRDLVLPNPYRFQ